MRRIRLIWQLFPIFLLIALIILVGVTWYAAHSWRSFYLQQRAADLENRAKLVETTISGTINPEDGPKLNKLCKDLGQRISTRLTIILPSGLVMGDSEKDPSQMDNHSDRPEIKAALKGGTGVSTRFSFTLGHKRMYVAVPIKEQDKIVGVVRASLPMTSIDQALKELYIKIALGGLGVALLVMVPSFFLSRQISKPLEELKRGALRFGRGDLRLKLSVPRTDELGSLAEVLNSMAQQLEDQIHALIKQGQMQEAVLSSMIEGVVAIDADQRIIMLNNTAAKLFGFSREHLQDRNIREVVKDPQLRWFINKTLMSLDSVEEEVTFHDGDLTLQAHGNPLRDSRGTSMGTLIVLFDVTNLRRLERTRKDFVANVSHELKTPITSIKGFVETLLAGTLREPENAENFLHIIAKQTNRLDEIINDLLSLSKIEQETERGQIILATEKIPGVLQGAMQVCEAKAVAKNIQLTLDCPDQLQARVNAPLLEQALVNLVDNAIKYSEANSTVQVGAERFDSELIIQVKDQGRGIEKEHLPRLFERFYRIDAGRSRKIGGTGLGLAIVKHIAQAHGGTVKVESSPGKGSTFSLHLPAA